MRLARPATISACLVLGFAVGAIPAMAVPESTFDTDLDGWTCELPSACGWSATLGNPGGYLRFVAPTAQRNVAVAPAMFLGNWSGLDEQGSLFLDLRVVSFDEGSLFGSFENAFGNYFIRIEGPGGIATSTVPTPEGETGWVTLGIPIRESAWYLSGGSWTALLQDVQDIQFVSGIINGGGEADALDNVRLVPEPATSLLMGIGLLALARWRRMSQRRD